MKGEGSARFYKYIGRGGKKKKKRKEPQKTWSPEILLYQSLGCMENIFQTDREQSIGKSTMALLIFSKDQ